MLETISTPLEASLSLLETPSTPMHVGALMVFRKPKSAGADYAQSLAGNMRAATTVASPWKRCLKPGVAGRLHGQWREIEEVDLDYHFRQSALPEPGGERELGVLVSRLHSHPLDFNRPPWECYLIEGLYDNQFALYLKLHPTLLDELGGMRLVQAYLAGNSRRRNAPPPWSLPADTPDRINGDAGDFWQRAGHSARQLGTLGRALGRVLRAQVKPDALAAPYTAPRSVLNGRINRQRRVATQRYELERLQRVAEQAHIDLDTLLLYLCGSALRRFLKEYNALPDESLIAAVPQSLQAGEPAERVADAFNPLMVSLGTEYADPRRRLAEIQRSLHAGQQHLRTLPSTLLQSYTLTTALPFLAGQLAGVNQWLPAMFNLGVVSLHGPDQPLYLNSAKLEAIYPISMLTQGAALNISCIRYAGTLNIGFTGARETLPRLQRIAVYMGLALEELEAQLADQQHDKGGAQEKEQGHE